MAVVLAGCGGDASAAALKGSGDLRQIGRDRRACPEADRPARRARASRRHATPQAIVHSCPRAQLAALTKRGARPPTWRTAKSPKDNVQGADGFSFGVGYDGHRVSWSDFSDDPPERVLALYRLLDELYEATRPAQRAAAPADRRRRRAVAVRDGRRRARADRRHPALALARGRGDAERLLRKTSSASGARAGRTGRMTHLPHLLGLPRGWPHVTFFDRGRSRTGSSPGSTPTRAPSGRSRGSTTTTTTPAERGPRHAAAPPCSSRPIRRSACSRSTRTRSGSGAEPITESSCDSVNVSVLL